MKIMDYHNNTDNNNNNINSIKINKLKILTINVNSIVANVRRYNLIHFINKHKIDIAMINETKLKQN